MCAYKFYWIFEFNKISSKYDNYIGLGVRVSLTFNPHFDRVHKNIAKGIRLLCGPQDPLFRPVLHCKNSGVKLTPDWIQYRSNLEWCQFNTIAVLF